MKKVTLDFQAFTRVWLVIPFQNECLRFSLSVLISEGLSTRVKLI